MKKLYEWKTLVDGELIDPPPAGPYFDDFELDDYYESEEKAVKEAKKYKEYGGFCDLVLLTVYEL